MTSRENNVYCSATYTHITHTHTHTHSPAPPTEKQCAVTRNEEDITTTNKMDANAMDDVEEPRLVKKKNTKS